MSDVDVKKQKTFEFLVSSHCAINRWYSLIAPTDCVRFTKQKSDVFIRFDSAAYTQQRRFGPRTNGSSRSATYVGKYIAGRKTNCWYANSDPVDDYTYAAQQTEYRGSNHEYETTMGKTHSKKPKYITPCSTRKAHNRKKIHWILSIQERSVLEWKILSISDLNENVFLFSIAMLT